MSNRTLAQVIGRALKVAPESITDASSPETLHRWDSLRHLDLMNEIEDAFGIRFTTAEIMQAVTVGDIRRLLREKGVTAE